MTGDNPPAPIWPVVLDANVLLQAPLRDTLLRLAEEEVLLVYWSEDILAEVARNFAAVSGHANAPQRLARLLAALAKVFPGALVHGYTHLMPTLPIPPHDRHVLACAIVAPAAIIVTHNPRHFPSQLLAPYAIQAWAPDTLLLDILRHHTATLHRVLIAQGRDLHPQHSLARVLGNLEQHAPRFAAEARARFGV